MAWKGGRSPARPAGALSGGEKRDPVTATMSADQFLLTVGPAVAESLPGGKIARKEGTA